MVTEILLGLILLGLGMIYNVLVDLRIEARKAVPWLMVQQAILKSIDENTTPEVEEWVSLPDEEEEQEEEGRMNTLQRGMEMLQAEYKARGLELTDADAKRQVEAMLAGHGPMGGAA